MKSLLGSVTSSAIPPHVGIRKQLLYHNLLPKMKVITQHAVTVVNAEVGDEQWLLEIV